MEQASRNSSQESFVTAATPPGNRIRTLDSQTEQADIDLQLQQDLARTWGEPRSAEMEQGESDNQAKSLEGKSGTVLTSEQFSEGLETENWAERPVLLLMNAREGEQDAVDAQLQKELEDMNGRLGRQSFGSGNQGMNPDANTGDVDGWENG